jgi:peroxiredoxin
LFGGLRREAVRETEPEAGTRRSTNAHSSAAGGSTMAISVGDKLPKGPLLRELTAEGVKNVDLDELTRGRTVVLFAVPGAFTPTCSLKHLPGFLDHAAEIRAKGVDEIVCLSVNDAFVMDAWGKDQAVGGKVRMLADGNGEFTEALGLVADASGYGMGKRSKRYAMVVKDGTVQHLLVEPKGGLDVSSAESVLRQLG